MAVQWRHVLPLLLVGLVVVFVDAEKQNFTIGFLPAMTNLNRQTSDLYGHLGKTYAGAINVSLDVIRSDPEFDGLNFNYIYFDTMYDLEVTLERMVDMEKMGVDAFVGPENNCVIPAKLAAALNKPMIGFKCLDSVLSDKREYPTFARTVPGTAKVSKSILALFEYYHWTSFSVVHQQTEEWAEVSRTLGATAEANNIHVNSNDTFESTFRFFDEQDKAAICDIVQKTSNHTRVYIFLGQHDPMVCFMKCLYSYSSVELHAVIHVRGFDDVFDYDNPRALEELTTYYHELPLGKFNAYTSRRVLSAIHSNNGHWLVSGYEFQRNQNPSPVIQPFTQLITLLHRKGRDNQDYQNFENQVRRYLHKPPYNIMAPPSSEGGQWCRTTVPQLPLPSACSLQSEQTTFVGVASSRSKDPAGGDNPS